MWAGEEMKMAEQHEFLDIAIKMARSVSRVQCLQKGGDPKEHWCSILVNEHDRLVEENARLTELAAQKASRADELFEALLWVHEKLIEDGKRYGASTKRGEIAKLLEQKQESNDE